MRPPSPSIAEREFLHAALRQSLRLDGRPLLSARTPTITFPSDTELGYVEVALGKTRVIARVDAQLVRPEPQRAYEGLISIHSELSPMASAEYEVGRPSEEEVAITRMLDKIIRRSDAVDKESLCVLAGQCVWHLRLTLHFLADAGNMLDCGCLAGMLALRHFRRPEVEVIGDEITVHPPTERAPLPLALHHTPYCFTFAFFPRADRPADDDEVVVALDPAKLEETLAAGTMSVALNAQRELCVVHKAGGVALAPAQIVRVVQIAVEQAKIMDKIVERALSEDWETRRAKVEVR